jgi:single-strand DNA-binding protein
MAKSVNKVILMGHLGKDPDVKYTPSGVPMAKFSLATNERYKDKSGEWQDRTEWHNLIAWQRLAEIVGEYTQKGSHVYIEGRLQTSSWEDKQSGDKKYRTEIVVRDISLLGGGREEHPGSPVGNGASRNGHPSKAHACDSFDPRHAGNSHEEFSEAGITDEDIPF